MKFLKEVSSCFYPPKYKQLKNKGFWKSYTFMLKVLFLAFIMAAILLIPKFAGMRADLVKDVAKIDIKNISGRVETTEPIFIPSKDPLLTVDLESDRKMDKEIFLINENEFQFRFFGKRKIELDKFKNPKDHKEEVGTFVNSMVMLLAPGFALILFVKAAIKYLLITALFGLIIFFLMDLTQYKLKLKRMLSITAHAAVPIILIETIAAVTNPKILLPFMKFTGLNIYAVTLIIWFFYTIMCAISVHVKNNQSIER